VVLFIVVSATAVLRSRARAGRRAGTVAGAAGLGLVAGQDGPRADGEVAR